MLGFDLLISCKHDGDCSCSGLLPTTGTDFPALERMFEALVAAAAGAAVGEAFEKKPRMLCCFLDVEDDDVIFLAVTGVLAGVRADAPGLDVPIVNERVFSCLILVKEPSGRHLAATTSCPHAVLPMSPPMKDKTTGWHRIGIQ